MIKLISWMEKMTSIGIYYVSIGILTLKEIEKSERDYARKE